MKKQLLIILGLLLAPFILFSQDILATIMQTSSANANDGSISLVLGGRGLPPYEIHWTGATLSSANNNSTYVGNLPFGNYSVHITDSQCGEADMSFYIQRGTDPCTYSLDISSNVINPCAWTWVNNSGSISANPLNGAEPYSYSWSNGATGTNNINNLWEGSYSVTITDRNGCKGTSNYTLSGLNIGSIDVEQICANGGNNRVTVNPIGGTPPYSYNWDWTGWTNESSKDYFVDYPQSRYVSIRDANGCETWPREFSLQPIANPLSVSISSQYSCGNGTQAQININQNGGQPPFNYRWSDGSTQASRNDLQSGTHYQVTVMDARGCEVVSNWEYIDYPKFELTNISTGCLSSEMKIEVKNGSCADCTYQLDGISSGNLRSFDNSTYFNMQIFPRQPTQLTIRDNRGCDTWINIPRANLPVTTAPIVNWQLNDKSCSARFSCLQDPSIVYGIQTLPLDINLPFNGTKTPCELAEVTCNIDGIHNIGSTFNGQVTLFDGQTWYNGIIRELFDRDCLWSVTCVFDHPNPIVGRLIVQAEGIKNCFALKNDDKSGNTLSALKMANNSLEVVSASPNPFKDEINILVQSNKSGTMRINLVNQLGQIIDTKFADISKGYSQTQMLINSNMLSEGMYMLVISDESGFRHVQRILHVK